MVQSRKEQCSVTNQIRVVQKAGLGSVSNANLVEKGKKKYVIMSL